MEINNFHVGLCILNFSTVAIFHTFSLVDRHFKRSHTIQAGRQANFIGDFFLFNICRLYFNFVLVYIMNYNVCARVSECIECFHHHRNHRRRHRFFVSNWWEKLSKMILDQWTFQTSKHTHSHSHPVRMYINRCDGILCTINRQVCRTCRINEKLCQFSRVVFLHTHCIQSLYGIQLPKINTVWKLYTASSNYNVNTQFMFYTYVCAIEQRALEFGAILHSVLSNIKCVHFATYTHDARCVLHMLCVYWIKTRFIAEITCWPLSNN